MFFICVCCLIGAIVYACLQDSSKTHNSQNVGGPANIALNHEIDSLQRTINYSWESGPVIYYANDYHSNMDREYRFNYRLINGCWRAYILRTPNFNSRSKGTHVHMLNDNGSYYICWDRSVSSIHDMQVISKRWADNFQEYLSTGKTF